MSKDSLKRGTTSKIVRVFIQDSSSATGAGLTGLVFNSSSLVGNYITEGSATATAISLVTASVGTWTSGGFVEVDATNMPGWYEIGIPNAALASGNITAFHFKGATNMAPLPFELSLEAVDKQDAAAYGLSRIDAAVSSRSTLDGTAVQTALTSQGYTTTRAGYLDTLNGLVATAAAAVWAVATRTLSAFSFTVATTANSTETAIKAKTDNLPASPAAVGSAMTLDLTQAVPTSNTAQTIGDALNAARADGFGKWVIDATAKTLTLYAPDGTTVVRTFSLDSGTVPTSRT